MFVATFYSFKGGVGRTSALVNVAAHLAHRGQNVLVVDFDLEAPGITAYPQFAEARTSAGLVDYVTEYIATAVAPRASDFMSRCLIGKDGVPVWVMPAGTKDVKYAQKLSQIDWQELYIARSGYILFEDLKQQWRDHEPAFDYVLIDSRTGHTDVGGICTRQLADVDVMMFLPNAQNIMGMKEVVDEIRGDLSLRQRGPSLIFAPSNVPDLDDEDGILATKLDLARNELGYSEAASIIHHYNSMSLIGEKIFTVDRPNSRLSREYIALHDKIIAKNYEDRSGALSYVQDLRETILLNPVTRNDPDFANDVENTLARIGQAHTNDPEVAWSLAAAYHAMGQSAAELDALSVVVDSGLYYAESRLRRARILLSRSQAELASKDIVDVFQSKLSTGLHLSSALELLRVADKPNWEISVSNSPAVWQLSGRDIQIFCKTLMMDRPGSELSLFIMDDTRREKAGMRLNNAPPISDFELALIGARRFEEAIEYMRIKGQNIDNSVDVALVFNYLIALWGLTGAPDISLASRVIELDDGGRGALDSNYHQCLALCYLILGQKTEASYRLAEAKSSVGPGKIFSCWTYLYRDKRSMIQDLDEMTSAINSGEILPTVLRDKLTAH